ncbi:MAG: TonB-dependent siderophore receptor, partial [Methylocystaceae bacterium]
MSATAIVTAMSALAFGANADRAQAHAQMSQREIAEIVRTYDIPAGPISTALNRLADESGARIVYDSRLTRSLRTRGLTGRRNLAEALSEVLSGTGLHYELSNNGKSALIVLAQAGDTRNDASASGATPLPTIDIGAEPSITMDGHGSGAGGQGPGDRRTGYNAVSAPKTLKTDAPLLKTPISVDVVTRQTMDDQQAISVGDALLSNVSGVTPGLSGFELFKVRGFYNTVGNIYKNGLMEYRLRNLDTTNLQSIEVLKGPAAMLFGRGEPGGIVNMVVKRPLETPYYSVQQQVKSFSGTRTTVDATGPLTDDHMLLYRFNGEFYSTDSYRNFIFDRNVFLAPTLTFHPIEQFRMNIDFEYQSKTWVDDYPVLPALGGSPASIPVSRYLSTPNVTSAMPNNFDRKRIAVDWTYEFLPSWSLTNRLAYYSISTSNENMVGTGFNPLTGVLNRQINVFPTSWEETFSTNVDVKGKFSTGPLEHSVLVGFDYFANNLPIYNFFFSPISAINIYAPSYTKFENIYALQLFGKTGMKWTGVYGQDMISFLDDSVHVLLGGRYDWTETGSNKVLTSYADALNSYVNVYADAFSPRVGVVYQPTPWL